MWEAFEKPSLQTLAQYLSHWQRIIGEWPWISSEAVPEPIVEQTEEERFEQQRLFWKTIVEELLESESMSSAKLASEINMPETWIYEVMSGSASDVFSLKNASKLLQIHVQCRPDLLNVSIEKILSESIA